MKLSFRNIAGRISTYIALALLISSCQIYGILDNPNDPKSNNYVGNAKEITSFSIVSPSSSATINEGNKTISFTVPYGTNVTALIANFVTTGKYVKVGSVSQTSGTTANDFTNPVSYIVIGADGSKITYIATATVAPAAAKAISTFLFATPPAAGIFTEATKSISVTVPSGTDVTKLVAHFTISGESLKVGTVSQVSGVTVNDFTNPVSYVVTAADASIATYSVTVIVATLSAKAITSFSFDNISGVVPAISEVTKTITATVPYGTNVTGLIATFGTSGTSVKVGNVVQSSGVTTNSFTNPVTYIVTAADGTTQNYVVTVTAALNSAKALTAFSFESLSVSGNISESTMTITATVPYGTNVTGLVATFGTSGASVKVGSAVQSSGVTPNNFTSPVTYIVSASDGMTQNYVVTVSVALNTEKAITSFSFESLSVSGNISESTKTITATVPYGTNVTGLVATFGTSGASVKVGSAVQSSGVTPNNFTNAVTYIVTAGNGSTASYVLTVSFSAIGHYVTYIKDQNDSGSPPLDSIFHNEGTAATVLSAGGLSRIGYSLAGWMTKADGTGTSYAVGATIDIGLVDISLFGIWIPVGWSVLTLDNEIKLQSVTSKPSGSLIIPTGITTLADYIFSSCPDLTSVSIPSSITIISQGAFHSSTNLRAVIFPDSITSIKDGAFQNCQLSTLALPKNLTSIGKDAFNGCYGLTDITITSSITTMGAYAFAQISSLTSVTFAEGNTIIGDSAFSYCQHLKTIALPASMTTIGLSAFESNTALESVTFPAGITTIGAGAFRECVGLSWVKCLSTVPPAASSSILGAFRNGLQIFVSNAALDTFKTAAGWSTYASQMQRISYVVGETGQAGGIVFYDKGSYSDGWRYLEAAQNDQSNSNGIYWYIVNKPVITTGTSIGSGKGNTVAIIAAQGSGSYAARLCKDLTLGDYSDWFLPSKDELNLMYTNLKVAGLGRFGDLWYWSSSQDFTYDIYGYACYQYFSDGVQSYGGRYFAGSVRACRSF